jgi:hypothetical protein
MQVIHVDQQLSPIDNYTLALRPPRLFAQDRRNSQRFGRGRDEDFSSPTGSPEAVARPSPRRHAPLHRRRLMKGCSRP